MSMKVLVVGVGSRIRADDGAGPLVCDILKERIEKEGPPHWCEMEIIDSDVMPESYGGPIRRYRPDLLLFVDAAEMGIAPGEIRIIPHDRIEATVPSTHTLPLSLFIDHISEDAGGRDPDKKQGHVRGDVPRGERSLRADINHHLRGEFGEH